MNRDKTVYEAMQDFGRYKKGDRFARRYDVTEIAWLQRSEDGTYAPMMASLSETDYFRKIETVSAEEASRMLDEGKIVSSK